MTMSTPYINNWMLYVKQEDVQGDSSRVHVCKLGDTQEWLAIEGRAVRVFHLQNGQWHEREVSDRVGKIFGDLQFNIACVGRASIGLINEIDNMTPRARKLHFVNTDLAPLKIVLS